MQCKLMTFNEYLAVLYQPIVWEHSMVIVDTVSAIIELQQLRIPLGPPSCEPAQGTA